MDEKILIKANLKKNYVSLTLFWLAAITTIMLPIVAILICEDWYYNMYAPFGEFLFDPTFWSDFRCFFRHEFWFVCGGIWMIAAVVIFLIIAIRCFFRFKCNLVVTNKRIYGIAAHTTILGQKTYVKRIDLPIDQIVSIGLGAFSSIEVVTASADRIQFYLLENREEVYQTISDAITNDSNIIDIIEDIIETNDEENASAVSPADELKKFKELLDMGVITQEEFEAKKKQLLGLQSLTE